MLSELEKILLQEKNCTGTSWTRNESFDREGYFVIKDLWDPLEMFCEPPEKKGQYGYISKSYEKFQYDPVENQVKGSTSRYWYPQYRHIHTGIRLKLEEKIGRKLYNTYYYDRYYNPGQKLDLHVDRDSCEISVTIHVSNNLREKDADWPIWIKTVSGEHRGVVLQPGDGMVYKGCERPHWREPLRKRKRDTLLMRNRNLYYHQIFFHYVLADGCRAQCAFDRNSF